MTLNEYQEEAMSTCMESCESVRYMLVNLVAEVAEFVDKIAKHIKKGEVVIENNEYMFYKTVSVEEGNRHLEELKAEADERDYIAPTISEVLKWLREEKGYHICISYSGDIIAEWEYEVVEIDGAVFRHAESELPSYECAALEGIVYCLDKLIRL